MRRYFLFGFFFFTAYFFRFWQSANHLPSYQNQQEVSLKIKLETEPKTIGRKQQIDYRGLRLIFYQYPEWHYGDELLIRGQIETLFVDQNILKSDSFANFQARLVCSLRPCWQLRYPKVESVTRLAPTRASFIDRFFLFQEQVRSQIKAVYQRYLPETEAGLLAGILLGTKENLSFEFKNALARSGVMHVVAASGQNVIMVTSFLLPFFCLFGRRRKALVFAGLGVIFYVFLAGCEPSVIRAGLMALFALRAQFFGRLTISLAAYFLTLILMLLYQPFWLFDLGFQLSFLASLGLILLPDRLNQFFGRGFWRDCLHTTLAAQILTLPVMLANFGNYTPLSLFANIFILELVGPLMGLGLILAFVGTVLGFLAMPFVILTISVLRLFIVIVEIFGRAPVLLTQLNLPFFLWIGYYFLIAGLFWPHEVAPPRCAKHSSGVSRGEKNEKRTQTLF